MARMRYWNGSAWIALNAANADTLATQVPATAATVNTIMQRDANGRAQIAIPSVGADIARLDTVTTHAALNVAGTHGSTSAPTVSTIMHRDASGRAQVLAPSVAADIARLDTVNNLRTRMRMGAM